MTQGPWTGRVTRTDGAGHPFVVVPALTGSGEYGPLPRVVGAGGWTGGLVGGQPAAVVERPLVAGDAVLITAVVGAPSVFVVLGRVV